MHIDVPRPTSTEGLKGGMNSAQMRASVSAAVQRRNERMTASPAIRPIAEMAGASLRKAVQMTKEAEQLLRSAFDNLGVSLRAHDRILKLARTIADLEACDFVDGAHVAEAIGYRNLDRKLHAR